MFNKGRSVASEKSETKYTTDIKIKPKDDQNIIHLISILVAFTVS